jgi:hypothetical protein
MRSSALTAWIEQAHFADKYRKRFGKVHGSWGNGSLSDRVSRAASEQHFQYCDHDFLSALANVCELLAGRKGI